MAAALLHLPPHASPRHPRAHAPGWPQALSALLVVALLFMQLLGLAHGIAHAGWPPSAARMAQSERNAALFNYLDVDDDGDDASASAVSAALTASSQIDPSSASTDGSRQHHHHSCVEYDAAAGTAGVHVTYFAPPLLPGTSVLALWQAFASWDAPFVRHFSSRAPPC